MIVRTGLTGAFPRSEALVTATRDLDRGRTSAEAVEELFAKTEEEVVALEHRLGFDDRTAGYLRWPDLFRPFAETWEGFAAGPDPGRHRGPAAASARSLAQDGARPAPGPVLVLRDARQPLGRDRERAHPPARAVAGGRSEGAPGAGVRDLPLLRAPARRSTPRGPSRRGGGRRLPRGRSGAQRRDFDRLDVRRRRAPGVPALGPAPRVGGRGRPRRDGGRPSPRRTLSYRPRARGRRPAHHPPRGPGGGRAGRSRRACPPTAERRLARPRRPARPPPVGAGDAEAPRTSGGRASAFGGVRMTRGLFPTQEIGSLAKPRWQILGQRSEP